MVGRIRLVCAVTAVLGCLAGTWACDGTARLGVSEEVLLVPDVNAGWAGWCLVEGRSAGGCGGVRGRYPIIAESWTSGGPPPTTRGYAVVTAPVMTVSIRGGPPIATRRQATLPDTLRGVVMEIRGAEFGGSTPLPHFIPHDAKGKLFPEMAKASPPLRTQLPVRRLRDPAHPMTGVCPGRAMCSSMPPRRARNPVGACRIETGGLAGVVADAGNVAMPVRPVQGLLPRAFLTCASTSYTLNNRPLLAGMLLDAAHPGSTPAPLPGMRLLPGYPGIIQAASSEGPIVGRRIRGAWLVVAKGDTGREGLRRRLTVLEHLRAAVRI
jgi:hypothetical protein